LWLAIDLKRWKQEEERKIKGKKKKKRKKLFRFFKNIFIKLKKGERECVGVTLVG